MKTITIDISTNLETLLKQFLHTDTMGTRTPLFIVQDYDGPKSKRNNLISEKNWRDVAYFFSKEEAKRYMAYQGHNLKFPRIFGKGPGYSNDGDWEPFYELLKGIAEKAEQL